MSTFELHFFPKSKILIARGISGKQRGKQFVIEAWGGPYAVVSSHTMNAAPTTPGTYIIEKMHPYRTPTWPLSRIKWGTKLRDRPGSNDVWYELPSGQWGSVKDLVGADRNQLRQYHQNLYGTATIPKTWVFNDFGPLAIRYYKDTNNNRHLDANERLMGEMFHTTAENEAESARGLPVKLLPSHGCIHIKPKDRDKLIALHAFERGTVFIVHPYSAAAPAHAIP